MNKSMASTAKMAARLANLVRKAFAGLAIFGESVWPGVKNDLFVAHSSIYRFFSEFTKGKKVLDAGCGTGYGTHYLAAQGASYVLGVDIDARSISYAKRHYQSETVKFIVGDCEHLEINDTVFDVVVASNMLEHLENPAAYLNGVKELLDESGLVIIALPPILSEHDMEHHKNIHYHRSNWTVRGWTELFESSGWSTRIYRHSYKGTETLDFASPFSSQVAESDFCFARSSLKILYSIPSISAIYVLSKDVDGWLRADGRP